MQRLRETFRRSKGPAIESQLSTSVSLEVPKQVRSASFDEIRFKKEHDQDSSAGDNLLMVPSTRNQRSRSFDSATTSSSSPSSAPVATSASAPPSAVPAGMVSTCASSNSGGVTSLTVPSPPSSAVDAPYQLDVPKWRILRRSSSDKSQCSACIHCQYMDEFSRNTSRSNSPPERSRYFSSGSETLEESESESAASTRPDEEQVTDVEEDLLVSPTSCGLMVTLSMPDSGHRVSLGGDTGVTVVSLQVPQVAKGRSASVDSSFLQVPTPDPDLDPDLAAKAHRSRSVDIVLPTGAEPRYALCQPKERGHARKAIQGEVKLPAENGEARQYRATPDWGESAINGDHLWTATSASGDLCYVGESECSKHGPRMKCPACKITVHAGCITILSDKMKFQCKPTFRDVGIRQYREQTVIQHHWVHRRYEKGKCQQCSKSFQSKLSFGSKEIVAISCTWCKTAYHNKESCFSMQRIGEQCSLGTHVDIIVPPSWIVKLPRKGSFKSSIRRSPKKRASTKKKSRKEGCGEKDTQRAFAIKPIPCASCKPLLVFINPRSGGNQGSKMMQKFQWLLNPRQVFDLSEGGPRQGLELYRKVNNLRILACGGDGTAGWILSVIDEIGIMPPPPVAVLPLGTGNDLARALGWGGGYTDEPISKILQDVQNGDIVQLDRWDLIVNRNPEVDISQCEEGKEIVPLNVVNNYFSIGVDAHIALEFHEAREAHPERFNSRLKNKMFYGQAGGKDLLQRKWKDLCNYVTLECDGQDYTGKLREHKVHSILFLNIPSYGGGTRPWGNPGTAFEMPQTDDGLIEVIGLTIYQMPFLQAGGHGTCLCQCRSARVVTSKTIPVQVDGEPCRLLPSLIELRMRNKACMVAKTKIHNQVPSQLPLEKLTIAIRKLNMADYENYHYDKERLRSLAIPIGSLSVNPDTDLENVRLMINQLCSLEGPDAQNLSPSKRFSPDWCFLDSCTAERFFRIDRAQEQLHYVVDIGQDGVYILDPEQSPIAPEPPPPSLTSPTVEDTDAFNSASAAKDGAELFLVATGATAGKTVAEAVAAASTTEAKEPAPTWSAPTSTQEIKVEKAEAGDQPASSSHEVIIAAKMGDLLRLKQLCDSGHSLLSADDSGMTALHHASRYGHKDVVRYIVASAPPAILDIADKDRGQTALHKAAAYKRRTICCMLVAAGASLSKADCQGQTAKQLAAKAGDEDLAAYLESQEHFERLVQDRETAV